MICPFCDTPIDDNSLCCPNCGKPLDNKGAAKATVKDNTPKGVNKQQTVQMLKAVGIIAAIVLLIVGVVIIFTVLIFGSKGKKSADALANQLGRSIERAEADTGFELEGASMYDSVLKKVVPYNFILESDKKVKVDGMVLPSWVVFIVTNSENKIQEVIFYDFSIQQTNWKGEKRGEKFDEGKLTYGDKIKTVSNQLGISPLMIRYSNNDTTQYIYKYYYVDKESKNEIAYSMTINYDLEGAMENYNVTEVDYISYMFK